MKIKISATLDEEIVEWIKKKSKQEHLGFSTFLNQIVWDIKNKGY